MAWQTRTRKRLIVATTNPQLQSSWACQSLTRIKDRLVWNKSHERIYNVKKEYNSILNFHTSFDLDWKEYKKLPCVLKILMFWWKCLNDALPLGTNLLKNNFNIDGGCAFGCEALEDTNHLFLGCDLIRRTWLASPLGIRSDTLLTLCLEEWLVNMFRNSATCSKDVFVKILIFS